MTGPDSIWPLPAFAQDPQSQRFPLKTPLTFGLRNRLWHGHHSVHLAPPGPLFSTPTPLENPLGRWWLPLTLRTSLALQENHRRSNPSFPSQRLVHPPVSTCPSDDDGSLPPSSGERVPARYFCYLSKAILVGKLRVLLPPCSPVSFVLLLYFCIPT